MSNKLQLSLAVFLLVILGILLVFNANNDKAASSSSEACNMLESSCEVLLPTGNIKIQFNQKPRIEEQIFVSLTYPETTEVDSAFIEGVNMYMGKIPVLLDSIEAKQSKGWFMLGSCTEPSMQWRLTITLKDRQAPVYVNFNTNR